jgi:hypothetical protein
MGLPGRVLVRFEAGAGERHRRAAAVDGRVLAGRGRARTVQLDRAPTCAKRPTGWPPGQGWRRPSPTGSAGSTTATPASAGTPSPTRAATTAPTWSRPTPAGPGAPAGRALLRAFPLTLDEPRPSIANATAAPNPFEPRPGDGDRDTTNFAMTSSERGRLRVVIYRYASTTVVRVLTTGSQAGGRQRVTWTGKTSSGAWLRGRFSYVIEATDAAGNTSRSRRNYVRVL